jgi:GT2 family glycosyltransferase
VPELDEAYHFYAEDTDYSLRLRAAGGRILHVPRALVLHKVSQALGSGSPRKSYLKSRSHVRLLRRHWPRRQWPGLAVSQTAYYLGLAVWHLWTGRPETARAALQGVIDELRGVPL